MCSEKTPSMINVDTHRLNRLDLDVNQRAVNTHTKTRILVNIQDFITSGYAPCGFY